VTPDQPQDQGQPTEEEMRAALAEELRRVRVEQVVMEATVSILNVAVMRAGLVPGSENERDLDQVRFGIEAVRGLLPLVEQVAGDQARPIRDALSQLQMAYVQAREESREVPVVPAARADARVAAARAGRAGRAPVRAARSRRDARTLRVRGSRAGGSGCRASSPPRPRLGGQPPVRRPRGGVDIRA
jgi:hypothetical protein